MKQIETALNRAVQTNIFRIKEDKIIQDGFLHYSIDLYTIYSNIPVIKTSKCILYEVDKEIEKQKKNLFQLFLIIYFMDYL